ncbi:hypothetical protein D3C73_1362970 [compost metagenome]
MREEAETQALKLLAQFRIVVDAAVEGQSDAQIGVHHRLLRLLRQVDDHEAPMSQSHWPTHHYAGSVRSPGREGVRHPLYRAGVGGAPVEVDLAAKTAHGSSLKCGCSAYKWLVHE